MGAISPVLLFYKKEDRSYKLFVLFFAFAFIHSFLLVLPMVFPQINFTGSLGSSWNWSGKLYSIFGSVLFYFAFRRYFEKNDFLSLKQKEGSLKFTLPVAALLVLWAILEGLFLSENLPMNYETLAFQLTMPGVDEELASRGIMLGLLATALSKEVKIGKLNLGHPGIWVTAIIFGLAHGLRFSGTPQMDWIYFGSTFVSGFLLAWITLKSGSILIPILVHNFMNTFEFLVRMMK
ncbi:CPBP family intramembrane metalloprotease [Candidatus Bipolaricaulota bacterium]|nr:CPBP family intramembrane metalloprotease [Candidatus Bipolaricaulota bacterium]